MVERTNKEIGQFLRTLLKAKHSEWAIWIPFIEQCLNNTYHDTIETTPVEAHFNKKPERIWSKLIPNPETKEVPDFERYHLISKKIRNKGERRAEKVNKNRRETSYQVGQQVLVRADNKSNALDAIVGKFLAIYEGPYTIQHIIHKVTYEVIYPLSKKIRGIFHTNLLRPYFQDGTTKTKEAECRPEATEGTAGKKKGML